MALKVRDYLEKYGYKVDYDQNTGSVLVTDKSGNTKSIGNEGFVRDENGSFFSDSAGRINDLLAKNGVGAGNGFYDLRETLGQNGDSVAWLDDGTKKALSINGIEYAPEGDDYLNIGGKFYASDKFLNSVKNKKYQSPYKDKAEKVLDSLSNTHFNYDIENDKELRAAQKEAQNFVAQKLNSQGVLNSSLNNLYSQKAAQELIPEYSRMAYERYRDEQSDKLDYLSALLGLDNIEYQKFADEQNAKNERASFNEVQKNNAAAYRAEAISQAIERIRISGNISNADALLLGLTPGKADKETMAKIDDFTAKAELLEQGFGYDYALAELANSHDLDILGIEHSNKLEELAKQFGYDLQLGDQEFKNYEQKSIYDLFFDLQKKQFAREYYRNQ